MSEKGAPFELCYKVLRRLQESGVLQEMVLAGSWCVYFYKDYFSAGTALSALRTRDMDFVIPAHPRVRRTVDIPKLLGGLGFIVSMNLDGYMRLEHPDLLIDFLVPERGRGGWGPFVVKPLGVTAQPLRYLNLLLDRTVTVKSHGLSLRLPHPIRFGFHKLLISPRRPGRDKRTKDHSQALEVLRAVLQSWERCQLAVAFRSLPKGWQKGILRGLQSPLERDILNVLQNRP